MGKVALFVAACVAFAAAGQAAAQQLIWTPGAHGGKVYTAYSHETTPLYPPDFKHLNYVNPNAPKGGEFRGWAFGSFDNINLYNGKGVASGIGAETLMIGNADEMSVQYGLLAESIEVPDDFSWAIFKLRAEAKWWDGTPVTADDVIFSYEKLMKEGRPTYRQYFKNLLPPEKLSDREFRFAFDTGGELNRELPYIAGQFPVLSKAAWQGRDFTATTLELWMSSGAYRIKSVNAPNSIVMERVPNYWGANLPINVGQNNFDTLRTDYYGDFTVALEAFKAGEYDFRAENSALRWATGYDAPAVQAGLIVRATPANNLPKAMQGFFINVRKEKFQDPKVREALQYVMDYEWMNQTLFFGQYARLRSFWETQEYAATGTPKGLELQMLEPFRAQLPPRLFTTEYNPPKTDGSGNNRDNLLKAQQLLAEAGWRVAGSGSADGGAPNWASLPLGGALLIAGALAGLLLRRQTPMVRYGAATVLVAAGAIVGGAALRDGDAGAGSGTAAGGTQTAQAGKLVNRAGEPMVIEFLLVQADFERLVGPMVQNLERLGVQASIRTIDASQYAQRVNTFDFDIINHGVGQSTYPGNEQREMWGCEAANTEATDNVVGICNPVVEALIDKIIFAPNKESLIAATNALDRVLQWNFYVVPGWTVGTYRIAYWDKFGQPETRAKFGVALGWWYDAEKARRLEAAKATLGR